MGGGGGRDSNKGEPVVSALPVSLEDLYNGKVTKMAITKNVICTKCTGTGTKSGKAAEKCKTCGGKGIKVVMQRMGPFIQQSQAPCNDCAGNGELIKDKERCPVCQGKKVTKERKVLEINIEKGMRENQKITFPGESDQAPGMETGDVIFVLKEKEHAFFKRSKDDLIIEKSIKLIEALTGVAFSIKHLDGRKVIVKNAPGDVIKPEEVLMVREEGMPVHGRPYAKGNLYIKFDIVFPIPEELNAEKRQILERALPPRDPVSMTDPDADHVNLIPIPEGYANTRKKSGEAYDEDEEGSGRQGGVQCQQQ